LRSLPSINAPLFLSVECDISSIKELTCGTQPGSGGYNAMKQQFAKWRDQLVAEGHMVPPPLTANPSQRKKGGDRKVRGFVRDMTGTNPTATKQLLWTEPWTHRKKSMDIPGVVRGSGNYMRQKRSRVDAE